MLHARQTACPSRTRHLFTLLVLLALTVRGFVPVGMMPDMTGRSGAFHLMICNGMEGGGMDMRAMSMDAHVSLPQPESSPGHAPSHKNDDDGRTQGTCAFAAVFTLALLVLAILYGGALFSRQRTEGRTLSFHLPPPHMLGSASPRGPPVFS